MDEGIIIRLLGNSVQNRQGRSFATPLPEEMHSAFRMLLASFSQPGIPPFLLGKVRISHQTQKNAYVSD